MILVKELFIEQPDSPESSMNLFAFSTEEEAKVIVDHLRKTVVAKYQIIKESGETGIYYPTFPVNLKG